MSYKLVASALHHPDPEHPYRGLFNKRTLEALANHNSCSVDVYSPIPHAPPIGPKSSFSKVPTSEEFDGYIVSRPRFAYFVPKSLLYALTGESFQRTITRSVSNKQADVFHGCHVFPDGYGLLQPAENKDIPLTVTCHGHFLNNKSSLPLGVEKRIEKTLNNAAHIFTVSDALAEKARTITNNTPVSTVPIGASPDKFPTDQREELRAKRGIDEETMVVLYCGQFIERKGVNEIINCLEELPQKDIRYYFIGHSGPLKDDLQQATKKTNNTNTFYIKSSVDTQELRELYAISDVFLLPSHEEGRPTAIYEAMASETAVLGTEIPGIDEQVVDEVTGLLISPGVPDEIITGISYLAKNRNRMREMGAMGQTRLLRSGWTWESRAEQMSTIHQSLFE